MLSYEKNSILMWSYVEAQYITSCIQCATLARYYFRKCENKFTMILLLLLSGVNIELVHTWIDQLTLCLRRCCHENKLTVMLLLQLSGVNIELVHKLINFLSVWDDAAIPEDQEILLFMKRLVAKQAIVNEIHQLPAVADLAENQTPGT